MRNFEKRQSNGLVVPTKTNSLLAHDKGSQEADNVVRIISNVTAK